ncbi:RICIN domain-containing protein [Bacillus cereus]|uniref:RICIN domain-containing protein n=1 Tax=Bacillus cereus TaxID=1396 RepID=UPI000BF36273|nr:RICIN domain-containing protein [Bacillus cereus]PER94273.1 hypothetical protein CN500_20590 [Bacillus cereus]
MDNYEGNDQKWKFVYHEEKGAYQIQSVWNPGLVLVWIAIPGSKKVKGHVNEHKEEHYWILEELEDGYYIIKNKKIRILY